MADSIDWDVVAQRIALQSGYDPTNVADVPLKNLEARLGQPAEEIKTKATEIVENPDITYSGLNLMTNQEVETLNETPLTDAEKCVLDGGIWNGTECLKTVVDKTPVDSSGDLKVINQMRDSFINALQASGMSAEMVNELWKWALDKFETDSSFTADRALLEM